MEKLFASAILIKPAIFMPKEIIILVLRYFSVTCRLTQNALCSEQLFGVTELNESLITPSLAEFFQCLCNFPFLTWESIPYKMLNMPYKKQSMFYIAFLFCIWCFHKHTSITLFLFETTAVPQWLAWDWLDASTLHVCVQGWKSFLFCRFWFGLRYGERKLALTRALVKDHRLLCAFCLHYTKSVALLEKVHLVLRGTWERYLECCQDSASFQRFVFKSLCQSPFACCSFEQCSWSDLSQHCFDIHLCIFTSSWLLLRQHTVVSSSQTAKSVTSAWLHTNAWDTTAVISLECRVCNYRSM